MSDLTLDEFRKAIDKIRSEAPDGPIAVEMSREILDSITRLNGDESISHLWGLPIRVVGTGLYFRLVYRGQL